MATDVLDPAVSHVASTFAMLSAASRHAPELDALRFDLRKAFEATWPELVLEEKAMRPVDPDDDEDDDLGDEDERAAVIADILTGLYGDDALEMLGTESEPETKAYALHDYIFDLAADRNDWWDIKAIRLGFTGTVTDKLGRVYHYVDGKRIKKAVEPKVPRIRKTPVVKQSVPKAPKAEKPAKAPNVAKPKKLKGPEAYAAATAKIKTTLAQPKSPESLAELVGHLSALTVVQLNALKKEHGFKASGAKSALVKAIAAKLHALAVEDASGTPAPDVNTGIINPVQTGVPGIVSGAVEIPAKQSDDERQHISQLLKRAEKQRDEADAELRRAFPNWVANGVPPSATPGMRRGYDDRAKLVREYEESVRTLGERLVQLEKAKKPTTPPMTATVRPKTRAPESGDWVVDLDGAVGRMSGSGDRVHLIDENGTRLPTAIGDLRFLKPGGENKPGFTGKTTDSLGRIYYWVDGKRVPGPQEVQHELERRSSEGGVRGVQTRKPLGTDAGKPHAPVFPGTVGGAGGRPAGVPAGNDQQRAGDVHGPDGAGDAAERGTTAGERGLAQAATKRAASGSPAGKSVSEPPTAENPTDCSAGNFRYTDRKFFAATLKPKFRDNIDAIRTFRNIKAEGRDTATPAEQEAMSKYIGWGQFKPLFNDYGWETEWQKERDLLKSLISEEEWDAAQKSVNNAHFTHPSVVDAHWKMAQKLGFKGGSFLETSAGIGYYLGMIPEEIRGKTKISAVELDDLTGGMLRLMYPKGRVEVTGFEKFQAPPDFYDLVASNVPFGDTKINDKKYNRFQASLHDYFFLKSVDLAKPGGLIMHLTSPWTMDKKDSKVRDELMRTCDLVAAFRFPGDTHKENAGTSVVTDMVILRKKVPGEVPVDPNVTPKEAQPKKPGFTGTTVDSLGRLYYWVDGKRVPGPKWDTIGTVPDPAGGEPIEVNQYFVDHPEQILGTLDRTGKMRAAEQMNVSKTDDYDDLLAAAIDRLPADIMRTQAAPSPAFGPKSLPAPGDVKEGGFKIEDGVLFQRAGGVLVEMEIQPSTKDLERIEGQLEIRDALRQLVNDQRTGKDADASRAAMNDVYDRFVEEYGFLNARANKKAFKDDPDSDTILALENYDAKTKECTKADMFSVDTVRPDVPVTSAADVSAALGVSLHETGGVNIDRMAALVGMTKAAVAKELSEKGIAFLDPSEGWKAADQYLSGNVRRKLVMARAAAAADPAFAPNVAALEKVQPVDLDSTEITVRMGASWIPPSDVTAFASELLAGRDEHFQINYIAERALWQAKFTGRGERDLEQSETAASWGTDRKDFMDVLNSALNGVALEVRGGEDERILPDGTIQKFQAVGTNRNGEPVNILNKKATEDANAKVKEMRERFAEWVWEDDDRRDRLSRWYNDNVNNMVDYHANGQHQTFPGMNPAFFAQMHPHIKDFVWQVVTTGKGLAAHEVGTGKTAAQIASAMELKRLGLANKPCIACLKANVEAITDDARRLYPGARILSTADVWNAKTRRQTIAKIMTGDYDLIIMTHDNLNMTKMRPETEQKYIKEELMELEAAIVSATAADPKKGNKIVTELNKAKANLQAKLQGSIEGGLKDDAVYFEDLGIDHLLVDEAHMYKTLPVYTKMRRVKGIPTGRSQRATNMLMRTRWLMENNNGRGVTFATGTPVSNTMAEVYTMQRYLQPEALKERGIQNFDAWAAMFGDVTTDLEFTLRGYQNVARFKEFQNLESLRHINAEVMDVQRVDELPPKRMVNATGEVAISPQIPRPEKHEHAVVSPNTQAMKDMMASFVDRANHLGNVDPTEDNMLKITTDGRKAAIDLRLLDERAGDNPNSKTNQCVANVLKFHKEHPETTQMIFSDIGVHAMERKSDKPKVGKDSAVEIDTASGAVDETDLDKREYNASDSAITDSTLGNSNTSFHLYGDIINKLVKGGIPRDRIANFSELEGEKKEAAMEDMKKGKILVGIGSTQKMGTGVNVQDKLAALHHLDVPWVPAAIEQRNGRGYRQGNKNDTGKVQIYSYVAEGSMDQQLWGTVGRKAKFINDYLLGKIKNGTVVKDVDTESVSPDQLGAIASGDPRRFEKVNLDEDIRKLRAAESRHQREQNKLKNAVKSGEARAANQQSVAKQRKEIAKRLEAHPQEKFHAEIGGVGYGDRDKAREAMEKEIQKHSESMFGLSEWERTKESNKPKTIGKYRGLDVVRESGRTYIQTPEGYRLETGDNIGSVEYAARNIQKKIDEAEQGAKAAQADVERVRANVGKEFAKTEELRKKVERAQELEAAFLAESAAQQPQNVPPSVTLGPVRIEPAKVRRKQAEVPELEPATPAEIAAASRRVPAFHGADEVTVYNPRTHSTQVARGRLVAVASHPQDQFVVHPSTYADGQWAVTDARSGFGVGHGDTPEAAEAMARLNLDRTSPEKLRKLQDEALERRNKKSFTSWMMHLAAKHNGWHEGKDWKEDLHPRDHGKFSSKPGASGENKKPSVKPAMSKEESKRVMATIKAPSHLPENHGDYFDIPVNAKIMPLDKLRNIRARPEGIENAAKYMEGSRLGIIPKRKPISVFKEADGTYSVIDGDSTFANAKANGWKTIPVVELTKEEAEAQKAKDAAHAKEKAAPRKSLFDEKELALPKQASQPVKPDAGYATLATKGEEANKQLQALLDLGKGIGAQLGFETIPPKSMTQEQVLERLRQPGGVVLLAPIKGEARATEKTNGENGGDWSKLLDIARASVAVDSISEIHQVLDKLRASGVEFARAPKDRIAKPTAEGYRDILTNIKMPNGMVVELQLHLKPILIAKAEGHHQYEVLRSIDSAAKTRAGKAEVTDDELRLHMTPEERAARDKAFAESRAIYDAAWEKAQGK